MSLRGVLVTAQPSLSAHEGNSAGVWTWNTWLPAYLVAASFFVLGPSPFSARLPFALSGILSLWLAWLLFRSDEEDGLVERSPFASEAGLVLLAFSPPFLLFCRQSRYYALVALGTLLVLHSWRRLLAGKPWGAVAVAFSLQFLLHSSFAFFACACLALVLDAVLRFDECPRGGRFWGAALLTLALAGPVAWYFRIWDRPGNHLYPISESLEFLKTFLLWLVAFAVPLALVAAVFVRRWVLVAVGFILLCGLVSEGALSRLCAVLVLLAVSAAAAREPAPYGVMNLRRMSLLLVASTLALLSFTAAEPYGRYLAGLLPVIAYLLGRGFSSLGRGQAPAVAGLVMVTLMGNLFFVGPLKAAQALAPNVSVDSVSGMMRRRLRDLSLRSDLLRFAAEVFRGPEGYIEVAASAMKAGGGKTFFSDADSLSLMSATGLRPVYPEELRTAEPDWLLPSPWLRLSPDQDARVKELLASGRYELAAVEAPQLMWQNNPDPLFRDFSPHKGPLLLFRRRP